MFIIFVSGVATLFVINKTSLNRINTEVSQLETQVKAMEGSEQQLILLKDRLAKITSIKTMPTVTQNLSNLDSILEGVSFDSTMNDVSIAPKRIDTSLELASNKDFTTFISNLKNMDFFKTITLSSLNYSSGKGYTVETKFENK